MGHIKTTILLAAFLVMIAAVYNLYVNNIGVEVTHRFIGSYIELGAIVTLAISLIFIDISERRMRKNKEKLQQAEADLEEAKELLQVQPSDVEELPKTDDGDIAI